MPVATELRAVWDGMRPPLPGAAGRRDRRPQRPPPQMQRTPSTKIDAHAPRARAGPLGRRAASCSPAWRSRRRFVWQRPNFLRLLPRLCAATGSPICSPCRRSCVIFAVIVFPFFYNLVLSLSDMSLTRFQDWRIVGLQNYVEVLTDPMLWGPWGVFVKTIVWTVVNVAFHVGLGVLLAVALNGPVRGKALYRVLLIIPWAVPAYITALTWRGMFDYEYGAVNLLLGQVACISRPSTGSASRSARSRPASSPTSGSASRS